MWHSLVQHEAPRIGPKRGARVAPTPGHSPWSKPSPWSKSDATQVGQQALDTIDVTRVGQQALAKMIPQAVADSDAACVGNDKVMALRWVSSDATPGGPTCLGQK